MKFTNFVTALHGLRIGNDRGASVMSTGNLRRASLFFLNHYSMFTIKKKKLIIELRHPDPEEFAKDLQHALFTGLRVIHADAARNVPALDGRELCDAATPMLELLQAINAHEDKEE